MRRDTINYLVVGIFVLTMFVLLLIVLYQITGRSGPTEHYFVSYGNVEGIKYGTPVLYEGYQVGQVELVEPVRSGAGTQFRLTLAVREGWQIPSDSIARVVKSGLLSAVAIDIKEGTADTPLTPGSEIRGEEAADLFGAMADVASDLRALSRESIRPLLDNINQQVTVLSGDLQSLTRESLRPLLDQDMKKLLDRLNHSADQLAEILSEDNRGNIDRILANLENASGSLDQLLVRIEESRTNLDKILNDVNTVVTSNQDDIRSAVTDLRKSLHTVSQHIEAVSHHMEGSSRNMHEFTRQIRENPSVLLRGTPQPDGAQP
jgi:phospholipid/cholesterol/gamma-HCH transport system substrate-binding protein